MGFVPSDFQYLTTLQGPIKDFTTDHLNNCYIQQGNTTLIKYDKHGKKLGTYSVNKHGSLGYVDANNPLKLLLFYPDFSTVITLDNNLSLSGKYDLRNMGIDRVSAIGIASDNNMWVYDNINYKLKKISDDLTIKTESQQFTMLFEEKVLPRFILERNNKVYLSDPDRGIYVFDKYATYAKRIPIKGLREFQILNNKLVYCKKGSMLTYNLQTFETDTIRVPGIDSVRDARLQRNRLFLRTKNGLALYALGN